MTWRHRCPLGRSDSDDRGFTLVELVVVLFIIAVLVTIAAVTFMGVRGAAQDRAAQSLAREALVTAKTIFQADEDYTAATLDRLAESEPGIRFLPGAVSSSGPERASVHVPDAQTFIASVYSLRGTCFYIRDRAVSVPGGGTTYAKRASPGTDCIAADTGGLNFDGGW